MLYPTDADLDKETLLQQLEFYKDHCRRLESDIITVKEQLLKMREDLLKYRGY